MVFVSLVILVLMVFVVAVAAAAVTLHFGAVVLLPCVQAFLLLLFAIK